MNNEDLNHEQTYFITVSLGNLSEEQLERLDNLITKLESENVYCDSYELEKY